MGNRAIQNSPWGDDPRCRNVPLAARQFSRYWKTTSSGARSEEVRQRHVQSQTSHMNSMYIEGFCLEERFCAFVH